MKILLFGMDGQVGWELQRSLAPLGQLVALGRNSRDLCGDLTDLPGLARTVATVAPDVIVNAAAYTAVDRAESEPALARTVNALAPQVLAEAAQRLGAAIVHYSSDYVFDGSGAAPWRESDTPAPLNVYGQTKLDGERLVMAACERHLVLRTSWVYGARGANFARTILQRAAEREHLSVVADQIGAPTGADLLADVTAHALRALQGQPGLAGLYHLAAAGETSWHGYASYLIERARAAGMALKVAPHGIDAVPGTAFPRAARRPANSRLDTRKLQACFALTLPDWRQGVQRMIRDIL